jgi:hypothetical protein
VENYILNEEGGELKQEESYNILNGNVKQREENYILNEDGELKQEGELYSKWKR